MGALFHCLPDEVGIECLLRVKLNHHHKLKGVCKSWNAVLNNPQFYQERKRLKISEQGICFIQNDNKVAVYDPMENTCKSLPPIPIIGILSIDHFSFVKQKLVLIIHLISNEDVISRRNYLWLYDFSCSKWHEGANMPGSRLVFATAADKDGGLIYIATFYRVNNTLPWSDAPIRTAAVYDVEKDKWEVLPDMNLSRRIISCRGDYAHGNFYVIPCMHSSPSIHVFDSNTRSWKTIKNRSVKCRWVVSAFGRLYGFSKRGLIEYDYSQDKVNILGPLPTENWPLHTNWATVVGHNIFVCTRDNVEGQALYMLVFPSETGGAIKWIRMESPLGSHEWNVHNVATTLNL